MATTYKSDDMANVLLDESKGSEFAFWNSGSHGLALTAIPWGDARITAINNAAAAKSLVLTALSTESNHWAREREFWRLYAALV